MPTHIKLVAEQAKALGVPIRIGVNAGSLGPQLYKKHGGATPEALVESALRELASFGEVDFHSVKISAAAPARSGTFDALAVALAAWDLPPSTTDWSIKPPVASAPGSAAPCS